MFNWKFEYEMIPAAEFTPHCDSQGQACDGCDQAVACPPQ